MLLYLRNETLFRIDTIELIDGCYPRITYDVGAYSNGKNGVRSPPPTEEYSVSDLNIEPALWGIILILDRVCVDIRRRRFSWATENVGKILDDEGTEDPSYRTHLADDELYEYDDNIDELFKLAEHLIEISHSRTKSTKESQEEQSCLIRMLYCCILPKIQVYQKDLGKVEEAIKKQMSYIKTVDNGIERHSQMLDDTYKVLCKQQDERLRQFELIASERKCTKKFVTILNADLNKRKHQLFEQIDNNQTVVQQMKADIQENGETEEKRTQLADARRLSSQLDKILQEVLVATVDTVKEALEGEGFQMYDSEIFVMEYLKSKEMSEKQKVTAKRQMEKKVRATSILENLKRIKEEITQDDGVASATMSSTSGVRPTDVINDSHVPEYQTLGERVAAIVNNPEHPFGGEFAEFTRYVRGSCRSIVEDAEISRESSEKRKTHTAPKFENDYLLVEKDGTLRQEYLTPLEKLCDEIKAHSDRMANVFLEQFNSSSDVLKHKLQLCYEENLYSEVGGDLISVYEKAYEKRKTKMIEDLQRLSTFPINCLDLGMKDEWWLELFEKRRRVFASQKRSSITPIPRVSELGSSDIFSSYSCTPPGSESSSITSSSSRSSGSNTQLTTNDNRRSQASVKGRRSPTKIRDSFMNFIRRKSKEVIESAAIEADPCRTKNDQTMKDVCSYDNYHGDTSYKANNMSGAIEPHISNGPTTINGHIKGSECTGDSVQNGIDDDTENKIPAQYEKELTTFAKYFGPSLDCLKDIFEVPSVFAKLKCITKSLTKVTEAVQELRRQVLENVDEDNEFSLAITADDLLPLMVLIMLQMDPADAASIVVEIKMMHDLIPRFLSFGCHGWALVEFDMASSVLQSLCTQFDWSSSSLGTSA